MNGGMFKLVPGIYGLLDGCPTACAVHEYAGAKYVNTGPFFRLMTPDGEAYRDDMGRRWTIVEGTPAAAPQGSRS